MNPPSVSNTPPVQDNHITQAPNSSNTLDRSYLVIDIDQNKMRLTKKSSEASTPKRVHEFVMKNMDHLDQNQIDQLKTIDLKYNKIENLANSGFLKITIKKILAFSACIWSFILNGGKTDSTLIKEIRITAHLQELKQNQTYQKFFIEFNDSLKNPDNNFSELIKQVRINLLSKNGYIFLKEMRQFLNSIEINSKDSEELRAAKENFSPYANPVKLVLNQIQISFNENVQLKIVDADEVVSTVLLPTTFTERVYSKAEVKQKKGEVFERHPDEKRVKQQIVDIYGEQNQLRGKGMTFEELSEMERVDPVQVENAATNKLRTLSYEDKEIFEGVIPQGSNFIANELYYLLIALPEEDIKTIDHLKKTLKKNVKVHNTQEELIDRETFKELIGPPKVPGDVIYAPEYKALKAANQNDEWKSGERKITFTKIPLESLQKFGGVIDHFFEDESVRLTLSKFLI